LALPADYRRASEHIKTVCITLAQPSVAAVGNEALVQTELLFAPNVSLEEGDGGGW
jgi:hypothetical protein